MDIRSRSGASIINDAWRASAGGGQVVASNPRRSAAYSQRQRRQGSALIQICDAFNLTHRVPHDVKGSWWIAGRDTAAFKTARRQDGL